MTEMTEAAPPPQVAELDFSDLKVALKKGWADFAACPKFGVAFGAVFALVGILLYLEFMVWESDWSIVPLVAGFPIIAPFFAVGLYAISRLREKDGETTWGEVWRAIYAERKRQVPSMAFVVLFIFLIWVYIAHLSFALSFGLAPLTNVMTSTDILFTKEGVLMLTLGTISGGFLSFILFSSTVVGIPLIVDKEIDVVSAIICSFKLVLENPLVMLSWGIFVGVVLFLSMLPMFLGLLVTLPVLGHATWHLYRLAIYHDE